MKNKIILVFLTMVFLTMTVAGCNSDKTITDATEESEISNKTCETVSTQEENSTLHFVDAHGQWYDALINPNVTKHEYDWQFLQNDGQISHMREMDGIQYGKVLMFQSIREILIGMQCVTTDMNLQLYE